MADNQAAIEMANNPVNHSRTVYVAKLEEVAMKLDYINKMPVDGLTKHVDLRKFQTSRSMMGLGKRRVRRLKSFE